jgi:hypothetical protein
LRPSTSVSGRNSKKQVIDLRKIENMSISEKVNSHVEMKLNNPFRKTEHQRRNFSPELEVGADQRA